MTGVKVVLTMVGACQNALFNYMYNLEKVVHDAESENKLPREAIGKINW